MNGCECSTREAYGRSAQTTSGRSASASETTGGLSMSDQFDFWLGTWDGTWEREGEQGAAVNAITKEHNGRVVVERFTIASPEPFAGLSVSVYDERDACWKQTWVDDSGAYLDFRGGFDGERMA